MTYSIEVIDTELNRNFVSVYRNYDHYLKVTMGLEEYYKARSELKEKKRPQLWEMIVSPEVRELINDVKKKNEEKEEYYRQVQERKNKYPHLFKDSH